MICCWHSLVERFCTMEISPESGRLYRTKFTAYQTPACRVPSTAVSHRRPCRMATAVYPDRRGGRLLNVKVPQPLPGTKPGYLERLWHFPGAPEKAVLVRASVPDGCRLCLVGDRWGTRTYEHDIPGQGCGSNESDDAMPVAACARMGRSHP